METIVIRTKIKPNFICEVREWFQTLRVRHQEVLESMANEGVKVESAFLDKHGEDMFVIYYMKAENVQQAYDVFNKSTLEIDKYFKENWKTFFEGRVVLEELLDLDLISSTKI